MPLALRGGEGGHLLQNSQPPPLGGAPVLVARGMQLQPEGVGVPVGALWCVGALEAVDQPSEVRPALEGLCSLAAACQMEILQLGAPEELKQGRA